MAKKILFVIVLMLALVCVLASCGHKHQWSEWQATKQATCTDSGTNTRVCDDCGESQTVNISANGHAFNEWSIKSKATCLDYQKENRICSKCGFEEIREGETKGEHTFTHDNICTVCNALNISESEKQVASNVEYISNRNIVYDATEQQYIFTFELLDKNENKVNPPTLVDIRIVDSNDSVIYENTIFVKTSDYVKNVATINIETSDFTKPHDNAITFYYKVYNKGYFSFSENKLDTVFVNVADFPLTYHGKYHTVLFTNIKYGLSGDLLKIYLTGEIVSCNGTVNFIGFKLYDSNGYIVKDDGTYPDAHQVGDKFKHETVITTVELGEIYSLVFDGQN